MSRLYHVVFSVVVLALLGVPIASPSVPVAAQGNSRTGWIAFLSNMGTDEEIYLMHADGSQQRNLTNHTGNDHGHRWSPDGSALAFLSERDGTKDIYVMQSSGANPTSLTRRALDVRDEPPRWSPDGRRMAFVARPIGDSTTTFPWSIRLTNPDGTDQCVVADTVWHPSWSPDGRVLAAETLTPMHVAYIVLVSVDGSPVPPYPATRPGWWPSWSPDGSRVAFIDGGAISIADTSGNIFTVSFVSFAPMPENPDFAWSPDGTQLAFVATDSATADPSDIYVVRRDGTDVRRLTNSPGADDDPAWSPDGRSIAFSSNRSGDREIYVMNSDGTDQVNISQRPDIEDRDPEWQPVSTPSPAPATATPLPGTPIATPTAPPSPNGACRLFPETGLPVCGRLLAYWEQNGGLPVFGLPISAQQEAIIEGQPRQVQWFERNRLELHPEHAPPYDVLLGRLGVDVLTRQGRDWQTFPRDTADRPDCRFFAETQQHVCGAILSAWQASGLELGDPGVSAAESLALFGLPISPLQAETIDGQVYQVQWFERARFELHPTNEPPFNVLLGRLGSTLLEPGP